MGLGANVSGQRPHGKQHPGLPATTGQVRSHGANPPCIASLRLIKDFWAALKKAVDNKGCESPSFPSLKGKICQKAHNVSLSMVLPLLNTIKERLTICARDEHWAIYRWALICLQRMTKSICTVFFYCQLLNIISFTYACLFKQKLVPIIHLT